VNRLTQRTCRPGGLHALWVLVPADASHERPAIEGRPVPVISPKRKAAG
jgi:hypothetical protein